MSLENISHKSIWDIPLNQLEFLLSSSQIPKHQKSLALKLIIEGYIKQTRLSAGVDFLQSYLHCDLIEAYQKIEEYID